jgi:2-iminobutanoate/2-iminopropanoate deaminase
VELVFSNTRTLLGMAQVSPDDIVYVGVYLSDNTLRGEVNRHWIEWFPHEDDRPARHTTVHPLPGGMAVQLQVVAAPGGDGS